MYFLCVCLYVNVKEHIEKVTCWLVIPAGTINEQDDVSFSTQFRIGGSGDAVLLYV